MPDSTPTVQRLGVVGIGVTLAVVILSPVVLSFGSLVEWANTTLGLSGLFAYIVPVSLDAAALLCMALTFNAVTHAESATFPRALVWTFAGASALANFRHGVTVSPDAALFFPAMPIAAALLLEVTLRRIRRRVLVELGVTESPLARFRAVRWMRFPRETFDAWSSAVEHGLSSPAEALAVASGRDPVDPEALAAAVESRRMAALPSDAARVRAAADVTGTDDPSTVVGWLASVGHVVSEEAARSALRRRRSPDVGAGRLPVGSGQNGDGPGRVPVDVGDLDVGPVVAGRVPVAFERPEPVTGRAPVASGQSPSVLFSDGRRNL